MCIYAGREPEYVIESKMSLAMAAQEHLAKIQDGKTNSGAIEQNQIVLDANGSFGGNGGPLRNVEADNKAVNK